ncbi:hypothetical protein [Trujillonella humicola]|uniref:hypothetical protein n=1 Tax=Trujillonella humicola TaxID=3383699 RepID=UPI0039069066
MDYLKRLQDERPVLFWVVLLAGFYFAFQVLLLVASLLLGGFSLPAWAPLALVLGGLVLVARRQQGSR